ncbi:4533_t:CDS:2 [Racocetra fulgida]|uniref:Ribose-5-phosphate isomerase n=1 Tax=Racocetra fulgida TaxID=60492 RepID=A0A9N9E7E5_9GLOM|nr:4533_t:CDS:2 [Racocetra fulgida]
MSLTDSKRLAAYKAVDTHLNSDTRIIGIGSGSTVVFVVERIVQRGNAKKNKLDGKNENSNQVLEELDLDQCVFVPTSFQICEVFSIAFDFLVKVKSFIVLYSFRYQEIDITIDGADEVDENLNAIKGGGACHLREKVVAEISKKFIIVADYTKRSTVLAGPIITDNGNFVIDAYFGKLDGQQFLGSDKFMFINSPSEVLKRIKLLTGVVEVGLFVGVAEIAYFGEDDGHSVGILKK